MSGVLSTGAVLGLAALGGGVGAAARYAVDEWVTARWRRDVPLGIFLVNVSGSLLIGLLVGGLLGGNGFGGQAASGVYALLGAGVLGGYTTFSTASLDAVRLARSGRGGGVPRYVTALGYAVGTMLATVAAALLGLWLGGWWL